MFEHTPEEQIEEKMDNAEYRIVEMRGEIERTGAEGMKDEVSANWCKLLFSWIKERRKIQGTYFKISALYFKIYGLYFLQHALCVFRAVERLKKQRKK